MLTWIGCHYLIECMTMQNSKRRSDKVKWPDYIKSFYFYKNKITIKI